MSEDREKFDSFRW